MSFVQGAQKVAGREKEKRKKEENRIAVKPKSADKSISYGLIIDDGGEHCIVLWSRDEHVVV